MSYKWGYLRQEEPRARLLYDRLGKYLSDEKGVLDFNCGFAPLYKYLKDKNYHGFDVNAECVLELKKKKKKGKWYLSDDSRFNVDLGKIEIFLYLGATDMKKSYDSKTEYSSALKLIKKYSPKIVVFEVGSRVDPGVYILFLENLRKNKYKPQEISLIDAEFPIESNPLRLCFIYKRNE